LYYSVKLDICTETTKKCKNIKPLNQYRPAFFYFL
jgi:hypothetical protein